MARRVARDPDLPAAAGARAGTDCVRPAVAPLLAGKSCRGAVPAMEPDGVVQADRVQSPPSQVFVSATCVACQDLTDHKKNVVPKNSPIGKRAVVDGGD